jgi:transcriptional regulator with XRE-family HTH domain
VGGPEPAEFGPLLRTHRERRLWSQERLAERAGLSVRAVGYLESGHVTRPRTTTVTLLADALGLSREELAGFRDAAGCGAVTVRAPVSDHLRGGRAGTRRRLRATAVHAHSGGRPSPPPGQLPIGPDDLIGRDPELALVLDVLDPDRPRPVPRTDVPLCLVTGPAGAGTTGLALHAGHRVIPAYPDGQLYADLGGPRAAPARSDHVLRRFLRDLRVPAHEIPPSTEAMAALFRSQVRGRRVLVVLDDAGSAAQVRPLLPASAGAGALVTSTCRLPGLVGARHVGLAPLSPDSAVALYHRVLDGALDRGPGGPRRATWDDELAAAPDVVRLCGFLPLAIRVAAARRAAQPHRLPADLVAALADDGRALDELQVEDLGVRRSIHRSCAHLNERQRRAFRRLALLDTDRLPAGIVGPVSGLPADEVGPLVDALVDAHLIDVVNTGPDGGLSYDIPRLVRLYGRQLSRADDNTPSVSAAPVCTRGPGADRL